MTRVGIGYDVHRLVYGRPLILGGVIIPFEKGLEGHSDADVLSHAISDALLGAAALGDIGQHFPNTDPEWKDISSLLLLENVNDKLAQIGFGIINIDAVLIAEQPKISDLIPEMCAKIANALDVSSSIISIKATTNEKLGFIGEGKGIAAQSVAMVKTLNIGRDS
ncbi:2-C-methyl-D-erythritol 2,4-cyclodiphosphate synthase [candidate division KSB1 bacterium]|nr:2-C-methyl-D-erythritol 2,4-cyclodiphosphate synthase [Bacteroidota bacterium]MCH8127043.1 2-C-methyl-D-erythritol 2,4-cyclodiphosphate synthase [candidate division KSB1 bacterium]